MRRIIHNTTAIAACLSLLVPQLAQAQIGGLARSEANAADARDDGPLMLAQADPAEAQARRRQAAEEEKQERKAEERARREKAEEARRREREAGQQAERAPREDRPAPERASEAKEPAPKARDRAQQAERPARDPAARRPAEAKAAEDRPERREPAARPAAAERRQPSERPAEAAPAGDADRPAQAERARQQDRPDRAARERKAGDEAPRPDARRTGEDAGTNRDRDDRAADREQRPRDDRQDRPDEARLREQLQRQQADRNIRTESGDGAAQRAGTREDEGSSTRQTRDAAARASGGDARRSQAAEEAARETRAARAAALNDDQRGEIVEERVTRENSRSSDEDFATSLRDGDRAQDDRDRRRQADRDGTRDADRDRDGYRDGYRDGERDGDRDRDWYRDRDGSRDWDRDRDRDRADDNDDDNDNDLAKALLLGLGAVAVGSYLNNNRQVALSTPDRVVVTRADGSQEVIRDDVALLRQPGSTVSTENFDDGSSRTVVTRPDGSRVVTIRDADLRVLRRTLISPDGTQTRLIDDTAEVQPVDISRLPAPAPVSAPGIYQDEIALRDALRREVDVDRRFTLGQIRSIPEVRALVPPVNLDAITFESGSSAISPDQARQLSTLGGVIQDAIAQDPREMFLIEGHTDAVGSQASNLALSDRRAESVALALTEYYDVPPENLVVQGYGEQFLQVGDDSDIRENRRVSVRRITDLLQTEDLQ